MWLYTCLCFFPSVLLTGHLPVMVPDHAPARVDVAGEAEEGRGGGLLPHQGAHRYLLV